MTLAARLLTQVDLTLPIAALLLAAAFYAGVRVGETLHLRGDYADRRSPDLRSFEARLRWTRERITKLAA